MIITIWLTIGFITASLILVWALRENDGELSLIDLVVIVLAFFLGIAFIAMVGLCWLLSKINWDRIVWRRKK